MAKTTVVPVREIDYKSLQAKDYIQYKLTETVLVELKELHRKRREYMRRLQSLDEEEARILASFR